MTNFTSAVTGEGRKLNSYDFDLRVVGFPTDGGQVALISATGLVVPAQDKNLEIAKKALSLMCSAEGEQIFCEKADSFPTRDDVTTSTPSIWNCGATPARWCKVCWRALRWMNVWRPSIRCRPMPTLQHKARDAIKQKGKTAKNCLALCSYLKVQAPVESRGLN